MNTSLSGSKLMLCAPSPTVSIQIAVQQQGDHALSGLWFGIMQINQVLIRGSKRGRKINLILLKVLMERKIQVFCSFSLMFFFPTLYSCPFFFFQAVSKSYIRIIFFKAGSNYNASLASHFLVPMFHRRDTKAQGSWIPSLEACSIWSCENKKLGVLLGVLPCGHSGS